jgi:hypothetical protein
MHPMKKILYESRFLSIAFDEANAMLILHWQEQIMDVEEFEVEVHQIGEAALAHRPLRLLGNAQLLQFTVSPDIQQWHDTTIIPMYKAAGVVRLAIVVSEDIFSQVSIEQTLESENAQSAFLTEYFDSDESAEKWLLSHQ